jgi:uncharacterized membrane protein
MKKILISSLIFFAGIIFCGIFYIHLSPGKINNEFSAQAADVSQSTYKEILKATVTKVLDSDFQQGRRYSRITQTILAELKNHETVEVYIDDQLYDKELQELKVGQQIVVGQIEDPEGVAYVFIERYRLPAILYLVIIFIILSLVFGKIRGLTSLIGLAISAIILIWFISPNLLAGKNPNLVILVGSVMIALISMLIAHGFKERTVIAIISTIFTLLVSQLTAFISVYWTRLSGGGSEESFYLAQGFFGNINLKGLFLGGIIIGVLGILNDITTSQAATVEEIFLTNPKLSLIELYKKAASVGQEHIASLINTLVLVYAGASLPLFLLLTLNKSQPFWAIINSESMSEEIVRTIVGSIALIIALPITTILASWYFHHQKGKSVEMNSIVTKSNLLFFLK